MKEKRLTELFLLLEELKKTIRKGWNDKCIKRNRIESVAEHIYGCQMLAYAMQSEFNYDIDISKVILMLAIHEIGETIIGDLTPKDIGPEDKSKIELEAIKEILKDVPNKDVILNLYLEFEAKETKEAKFAYQIDKLECDIQAKLYDQEGCFSELFKEKDSFSKSWIGFDKKRIPYDRNFSMVIDYLLQKDISIKKHSENKVENVLSFYITTNKLKNIQRSGEKVWKIKKERYGSIAEHIYSVEMLALLIYMFYGINVDIKHVISLISNHETEEIEIGDIPALLKTSDNKEEEMIKAKKINSLLSNNKLLDSQTDEYNQEQTKEAIYSKLCDKLAPDIISKVCDQEGLVDLNDQKNNPVINNPIVSRFFLAGASFSQIWIGYGQEVYKYPDPFMRISKYVNEHTIVRKTLKRKKLLYQNNSAIM